MKNEIDIEEKIKAIIYDKLRVDEKDITLMMNFQKDLGADSIDLVDLIMGFEKEFDIVIPDNEAENIHTVGEAIEYIKSASLQKTTS